MTTTPGGTHDNSARSSPGDPPQRRATATPQNRVTDTLAPHEPTRLACCHGPRTTDEHTICSTRQVSLLVVLALPFQAQTSVPAGTLPRPACCSRWPCHGPGRHQAELSRSRTPSCNPRTTREDNIGTATWASPAMALTQHGVGFTSRPHCEWWAPHRVSSSQGLRFLQGIRRDRLMCARRLDAVGLSGERQAPRAIPPVPLAQILHPDRDPSTTTAGH